MPLVTLALPLVTLLPERKHEEVTAARAAFKPGVPLSGRLISNAPAAPCVFRETALVSCNAGFPVTWTTPVIPRKQWAKQK